MAYTLRISVTFALMVAVLAERRVISHVQVCIGRNVTFPWPSVYDYFQKDESRPYVDRLQFNNKTECEYIWTTGVFSCSSSRLSANFTAARFTLTNSVPEDSGCYDIRIINSTNNKFDALTVDLSVLVPDVYWLDYETQATFYGYNITCTVVYVCYDHVTLEVIVNNKSRKAPSAIVSLNDEVKCCVVEDPVNNINRSCIEVEVSEQPPKPNDDCSRCELMHTLSGTALGLAFTGMVLGCVFYYFKVVSVGAEVAIGASIAGHGLALVSLYIETCLSCSFAFRIVCAVITGLAIGVSITLVVMTSVSNKTKRERTNASFLHYNRRRVDPLQSSEKNSLMNKVPNMLTSPELKVIKAQGGDPQHMRGTRQ